MIIALQSGQIADGLSSIQKTADGSTFAFSQLELEDRGLDSLGDALADYDHLRIIKINKNRLNTIDKLRTLKYLQVLEARDNQILDNYFMSESKQQLRFLTTVDLSGNKLSKLRQLLCLNLRTLALDNNNIADCDMVGHSALVNLSVVKNKLTSLDGFVNLTALENLNLAENQITTISGIKGCAKLQTLNLAGNKITEFEKVPYLPGLRDLNLQGNPIEKLEGLANLINLKNLQSLNLVDTPLFEEKADDLKKEILILLDGLNFTSINGEEVTSEDIQEAKAEKEQRIKDAEEARIAAEEAAAEEARLAKEAEEQEAAE